MGAHIFLASQENFEVCVSRGVYGCVAPDKEWNKAEIVAGILSIQPDDLVFFYVKNQGIHGLWRVVGEPFFDDTKIWVSDQQRFPYRVCFEPAIGDFHRPVSLSDVFDLRDKGRIWTFDLNPVQKKNQYKITMEEASELLRLLLRNNPTRQDPRSIADPYVPAIRSRVAVDLSGGHESQVRYEGWLNAWFTQALARGELRDLVGDYREFLNLVPTTFNKVMDIFLTHVTRIGPVDILHKFTCIELKADRATEPDLAQVLRYEDWLARRLAGGDKDMIQSILVANRFSDALIAYVRNRRAIEEKSVRLVSYHVASDRTRIELEEITV